MLVGGAIALVALGYIPGGNITPATAFDGKKLLKFGGGGLLTSIIGVLMVRGGIHAVLARRMVVVDEDSRRRREVRGCSAVINGLGQLLFGLILTAGGIGLLALAFFQQILPLLG